MVAGAAVVAAGLVLMGFTREMIGLVVADPEHARQPTIALAVLSIYVVDFAINVGMPGPPSPSPCRVPLTGAPVQSCARSLVVDTLPLERQQTSAAWSEPRAPSPACSAPG